jgi:hypothetical protein
LKYFNREALHILCRHSKTDLFGPTRNTGRIAKLWPTGIYQHITKPPTQVTVYRIIMKCIRIEINVCVPCLISHASPSHCHVFDVVSMCRVDPKSSAIFVCYLTGVTAPCPCVAATRCLDRWSQRHVLSDLPQVVPRRGGPHGAHEAHT